MFEIRHSWEQPIFAPEQNPGAVKDFGEQTTTDINNSDSAALEVRPAAKIILQEVDSSRIIVVQGRSGRINLPGGGIDMGEVASDALWRELEEELGFLREHHLRSGSLRNPGIVEGKITTREGVSKLARWCVFVGQTHIPAREFIPGDEESSIFSIDPHEFGSLPNVSDLGRCAVEKFLL